MTVLWSITVYWIGLNQMACAEGVIYTCLLNSCIGNQTWGSRLRNCSYSTLQLLPLCRYSTLLLQKMWLLLDQSYCGWIFLIVTVRQLQILRHYQTISDYIFSRLGLVESTIWKVIFCRTKIQILLYSFDMNTLICATHSNPFHLIVIEWVHITLVFQKFL